MLIPQGNWIIVCRHCRDSESKGQIVKAGLKEETAKRLVLQYSQPSNEFSEEWNYWAMHKEDY